MAESRSNTTDEEQAPVNLSTKSLQQSELSEKQQLARNRFKLILIFIVIAVLLAALQVLPVRKTTVKLSLPVSGFTARLKETLFIPDLALTDVNFSNPAAMTIFPETMLGRGRNDGFNIASFPIEPKRAVEMHPDGRHWNTRFSSDVLLLTVKVDTSTKLGVSYGAVDRRLNFLIQEGRASGLIYTGKAFMLSGDQTRFKQSNLEFTPPGGYKFAITTQRSSIHYNTASPPFAIDMGLGQEDPMDAHDQMFRNLPIQHIAFTLPVEEKVETTLVGKGIIQILDLDKEKMIVDPGDHIFLDGLENFLIKRVLFEQNMRLELIGSVSEIKTGIGKFLYSRKPSILEWLYRNHDWSIFLALLIPLFLMVRNAFQRLKLIK